MQHITSAGKGAGRMQPHAEKSMRINMVTIET